VPQASLLFVRHAPTPLNEAEVARGWSAVRIDPKRGVEIAQKAALELAKRRIQLVVSSDIQRALDTAKIIARICRAPIYPTELLRPWNIGELEGLPEELVRRELEWYRKNPEVRVPGGESSANLWATRMPALRELLNTAGWPPYPRIATVMHKSVLLLLPAVVYGTPVDPEERDGPEPGELVEAKIGPRGVKLEGM
jgi:broad specificity phosphatase PhoE